MSEIGTDSLKEKLAEIVGEPKVDCREEHLLDFSRANIGSGEKPLFIVNPKPLIRLSF